MPGSGRDSNAGTGREVGDSVPGPNVRSNLNNSKESGRSLGPAVTYVGQRSGPDTFSPKDTADGTGLEHWDGIELPSPPCERGEISQTVAGSGHDDTESKIPGSKSKVGITSSGRDSNRRALTLALSQRTGRG